MRGLVLAGAVGVLLTVSAGAQEPRPVRAPLAQGSGWHDGYNNYRALRYATQPFGMWGRGYGSYQPYGSYAYPTYEDGGSSFVMPTYHSLTPGRYERSARGYYILPPNFSDDEEQEAKDRPQAKDRR